MRKQRPSSSPQRRGVSSCGSTNCGLAGSVAPSAASTATSRWAVLFTQATPSTPPRCAIFGTPGTSRYDLDDDHRQRCQPRHGQSGQRHRRELGSNVTLSDAINAANNTRPVPAPMSSIAFPANTTITFTYARQQHDHNQQQRGAEPELVRSDALPAITSNITIQGHGDTLQFPAPTCVSSTSPAVLR